MTPSWSRVAGQLPLYAQRTDQAFVRNTLPFLINEDEQTENDDGNETSSYT